MKKKILGVLLPLVVLSACNSRDTNPDENMPISAKAGTLAVTKISNQEFTPAEQVAVNTLIANSCSKPDVTCWQHAINTSTLSHRIEYLVVTT